MKSYLRIFAVALAQSAAILVVMAALYVLVHLAVHQDLPRWK